MTSRLRGRPSVGIGRYVCVQPHVAVKSTTRQADPKRDARLGENLVPAVDATLAIVDIRVAHDFVHRVAERDLLGREIAPSRHLQLVGGFEGHVVGIILLLGSPFEPARKEGRRIR